MSQPQQVSAEKLLELCLEACEDRKAVDIQAFDLRGESVMADYLVICTGNSTPQLQAIQASVDKALKAVDVLPKNVEGRSGSQWILMDYVDVLVHIFHPEGREYYRLEELVDPERQIYPPEGSEED